MRPTHPIIEALHKRRVELKISLGVLAKETGLNRNTLYNHESKKFPSLTTLDLWCSALGFRLTLADIPKEAQNDEQL
jgi:DNA-binding phage protein